MGTGRRRQPGVELGEAAPGAHGGEGGGEAPLRRGCVVGVGGGDATDVAPGGDLGEGVVAGRVERVAVIPQLDEDTVAPERFDQAVELAGCGGRPIGDEGGGDGALTAAGQGPRVTGDDSGDIVERELRRALLPGEVAEADRPGELGVSARPVGEEQEVLAVRIRSGGVRHVPRGDLGERLLLGLEQPVRGEAVATLISEEGQLGAEDRRHPQLARRLGEADDAVEAVVVGEGERFEAEARRLGDELLGVRRPVEEREVGVAVQLGIGH